MKVRILVTLLALAPLLPAAADTRLDEIDELRLAGDYEPAILRTLAELETDPGHAPLLNLLGELRLDIGMLDDAALNFDAARQVPAPNPVELLATLNRAKVFYRRPRARGRRGAVAGNPRRARNPGLAQRARPVRHCLRHPPPRPG